jgi:hypothetical protein
MKEESCGMQTSDIQSGPLHSYSLLSDGYVLCSLFVDDESVLSRVDGDLISALSNGDSLQISEVMDRLGRMEELLSTIIQRYISFNFVFPSSSLSNVGQINQVNCTPLPVMPWRGASAGKGMVESGHLFLRFFLPK